MARGERLHIYDVSLRDGLQRHHPFLSTGEKLRLYQALRSSGLLELELTSFVSHRAVPQLADAAQLYQQSSAREAEAESPAIRRDALVINARGLEEALAAGVSGVSLVLVASETLSQRNSRVSMSAALERAQALIQRAKAHQRGSGERVYLRAYVAAAWVCPFEGPTPLQRSAEMSAQLLDWGADEVALADTVGHATPPQVTALIELIKATGVASSRLAVHLHDTLAFGLANATAAIEAGVRRIDAAIGGLGGCPFAPGAQGNLATEDIALLAARLGYETGVDLEALHHAVELAEEITGRKLGGRTRAWWSQRDPQSLLSETRLGVI